MALTSFIKFALLVVIMAYNNVKASPSPGLTDDVLDVVGDFSSRFTLLSKTYLDTYDLTDKRLVRDLSVKPSLEEIEWTQILQCWPGCEKDYYLVDYHINGDKTNPTMKVYVAKTGEVKSEDDIPNEFRTSGYKGQLHFGFLIFDDEIEDLIFFVIHPNSWGPFQSHFKTNRITKFFKDAVNNVAGGVGFVAIGAAVGSIIPGAGTLLGAGIGAVSGTVISTVSENVFGYYLRYIG